MYGRKVRVRYTGQPVPEKVDIVQNKDIINAGGGGELPEKDSVVVETQENVMEVTEA